MLPTSVMLSNENAFGQFVAEINSTLVVQRFMQGTFENMLLATGGMWIGNQKGESFGNLLLSQNRAKDRDLKGKINFLFPTITYFCVILIYKRYNIIPNNYVCVMRLTNAKSNA